VHLCVRSKCLVDKTEIVPVEVRRSSDSADSENVRMITMQVAPREEEKSCSLGYFLLCVWDLILFALLLLTWWSWVILTCILQQEEPIQVFIYNWLSFNCIGSVSLVIAYLVCNLVHWAFQARSRNVCSTGWSHVVYFLALVVYAPFIHDFGFTESDSKAWIMGAYIISVIGLSIAFWYAQPGIVHEPIIHTVVRFSLVDDYVAACLVIYCLVYLFLWALGFFVLSWACFRRNKCCSSYFRWKWSGRGLSSCCFFFVGV
jgi:hypothetical protein